MAASLRFATFISGEAVPRHFQAGERLNEIPLSPWQAQSLLLPEKPIAPNYEPAKPESWLAGSKNDKL